MYQETGVQIVDAEAEGPCQACEFEDDWPAMVLVFDGAAIGAITISKDLSFKMFERSTAILIRTRDEL
jgi:hypothetical protein